MKRAVFLDRDGTVMEDVHYCADPEKVRLLPGAKEALCRLKEHGFLCVIVTNQSGIARGLLTEAQYHAVHAEFEKQLGAGCIDGSYFCPDLPPSERRKPAPGMLREAERDLEIDLQASWFIGDRESDIACGAGVGMRTILVQTGKAKSAEGWKIQPNFVARDLSAAAERILRGM